MVAQPRSLTQGIRIEILSIAWMVVEASVALASGIAAHSLALAAFGADSVIELAAGSVLLWRLALEARGARSTSIEKAEKLSSWSVGIALLLLALFLVVASLTHLLRHEGAETSLTGMSLAFASGILMPFLSRAKKRIGADIGSAALRADGACSIVCAYMAWIVLAGTALTAALGWWWLDSLASLALVYYVAEEGREAIQEARGAQFSCECCGKND